MITANGAYNVTLSSLSLICKSHIVDDEGNITAISYDDAFIMKDKTDLIAGKVLFTIEKYIEGNIPSLLHGPYCSMRIDKAFFTDIGLGFYVMENFKGKAIEKIRRILEKLGYNIILSDETGFTVSWLRKGMQDYMMREKALNFNTNLNQEIEESCK